MREKLVKLLCEAHNISTEAACFENMTYAGQLRKEADHLIANGVTFATDNNVGDKMTPTDKDTNVLTNADSIRSMTDQELAEFLCGVYDDENCGVYGAESGKFINGITILDYDEFKILEWLLRPTED